MNKYTLFFIAFIFLIVFNTNGQQPVIFSEVELVLPTYPTGDPEINPQFYVPKDVQGTKALIYPYPLIDKITDEKNDEAYKALILENEYIKFCVLPELGGRIHYAVDKTNNYDFFYYNHVIKPALIGTAGAWLSGGAEWNANHHHRISGFMPIDYRVVEQSDGSKTIWVGEYDKRHGTRWEVGLTLKPGKAYIEKTLKMLNVTPVVNSFLYFANIAVHSNQNYQVIFPPDVEKVVFHHKIEFATWPEVNKRYRNIDFTKGYDVSWWKNTFAPTSFFAWDTKYDFVAGYDHGKKAGTLLIGDHHQNTGKKFWNWGNNDIGHLWDNKILTDGDGSYIELMMGAYADNQPDYSWYDPFTTKEAVQYYYPVKSLNSIKNADKDFAINLEIAGDKILVQANATSIQTIIARILHNERVIAEKRISISPLNPIELKTNMPKGANPYDIQFVLTDTIGKELISYHQVPPKNEPMADVYTQPENPEDIKSTEDVYMAGLRQEQFYNPTYDPRKYYLETLKRDPKHILANTQMGISYLTHMQFDSAEVYLKRAKDVITQKYTTAKNPEAIYYLGVCYYQQGKFNEAYDLLAKAAWSFAWTSPSYFLMALMDNVEGDPDKALSNCNKSLFYNNSNVEALLLKSAILRNQNKIVEAKKAVTELLEYDPLNFGAQYELALLNSHRINETAKNSILTVLRDDPDNYLETAYRYIQTGFYHDAIGILSLATSSGISKLEQYPILYYYLGYCYLKMGENTFAADNFAKASHLPIHYCSPYGLNTATILMDVIRQNPKDANAHYFLGNIMADHNPLLALKYWEQAININGEVAIYFRNAAFVLANVLDSTTKAKNYLEKAIELNNTDPVYFVEWDKYNALQGSSFDKALTLFKKYPNTIKKSDEAMEHFVQHLVLGGEYDKAIEIMKDRHFHSYESFEGGMHFKWVDAHILRGKKQMAKKNFKAALNDFLAALEFPVNLDLLRDARSWMAYYYAGLAYKNLGDLQNANIYFNKCINATDNDGWGGIADPHVLYSKVLSYRELGQIQQADSLLYEMNSMANALLKEQLHTALDLASAVKRYQLKQNKAKAYLLKAFTSLAQNNTKGVNENFEKALSLDPYCVDAKTFLKLK